VFDVVAPFIARRRSNRRLASARGIGNLMTNTVERRVAARMADHGMRWTGPLLSVPGLRRLGAEVADSLVLTPAERRALIGVSSMAVPPYLTGSPRVVDILDRAFQPLTELLRRELAGAALLDRDGRLRW
jgi:hypothetical protein